MKKAHIGSNFDDFLQQDGLLAECAASAHRRVVTWQIKQEMKRRRISRTNLASRMKTSRTTLDLLFAENETPATFQLLERARWRWVVSSKSNWPEAMGKALAIVEIFAR